ncbi:MAG: sulfurtransferase complex subunit TusC [Methyloprofundus sp.]|nr:sulfurtransferase complex subunit TusC [Methyloprofundus sp.]MDT8426602.1 sulfurtransferase complex subunit TusC [Methyloprofundus sp.]
MSKSFLFVMQTPAYSGNKTQEVLDMVLITAAFDQKVSLLLLDDAVFHLKNTQQSAAVASKEIGAIYRSLELYDIEDIYVEQESLNYAGLSESDLLVPVKLVVRRELPALFKAFDCVLEG